MEISETEIRAIILLLICFVAMLCMSGWLTYSFYIKPEQEEKKKQLSEKL